MRNLKKILALVLALVMSMSVMSVASADFKDTSTISKEYATAVDALAALEVFKGYENGNFNPKGTITRAEVAAIIYRIDTTDINDKQASIYADYSKFSDVSKTAWYAGYVNYCANAEFVKGVSDTEFNPNGLVTGYQVLAMILRVVGYDQNDEFTGNAWQLNVASTANQLGITRNVTAGTLGQAATRELVAELLFRAIVDARQVNYTLAFGYSEYQDLNKTVLNKTIEQEKIGMYVTADKNGTVYARDKYNNLIPNTYAEEDIWGRPSEYWIAPLWTKDVLADLSPAPLATYSTAVVECDLATLLGLQEETVLPLWENGIDPYKYDAAGNRVGIAIGKEIEPLHTNKHNNAHKIGEQGTLMEVYEDRIIMIDTYLAEVTGTVTQKTDKAGHISRYPTNTILVYNDDTKFVGEEIIGDSYTISGNDYATGEYLLVNVYEGDLNLKALKISETNMFIVGTPDEVTAKQTKIWWNAEKHTIDGTEFDDSINYVLDVAGFDKDSAYRWFFCTINGDEYVIGSDYLPAQQVAAQYAVVLGAQWINSGKYAEKGYAYGTVQYLDGTAPTETLLYGLWDGEKYDAKGNPVITEFSYADTYNAHFSKGTLCTTYQYNQYNEYTWQHLYQVIETEAGLVLIEVTNELMEANLWDGVSLIDTDEDEIYTDNETVYFFHNHKTGVLDSVKGYDNLNKDYAVVEADVVDGKFAAQFVYLPFYDEIKEEDEDETGFGYYYITDDAMSYLLKNHFAIVGVVDAEGNTDPLLFKQDFAGKEEDTERYLDDFVAANQNKLFLVEFLNGYVVEMTEVKDDGFDYEKGKWNAAKFVDDDDYEFIETGVLKVYGDDGKVWKALNVNGNTVIINEDGVGTLADMLDLEGNDLYVIYKGTTAIAVFVVPVEE